MVVVGEQAYLFSKLGSKRLLRLSTLAFVILCTKQESRQKYSFFVSWCQASALALDRKCILITFVAIRRTLIVCEHNNSHSSQVL